MMKINSLYSWAIASCLALGTLTACNEAEPSLVGGGELGTENSGIPGLSDDLLVVYAHHGTTELEVNQWTDRYSFGLFLTKDSIGNPYENDDDLYSNIRCTYTKEGWKLDPERIPLSERPAVIYAYAPYREDLDPYAMPVECESGTYYMYGTHVEPQTSVRKGSMVARLLLKQTQALLDFKMRKREWRGELVLEKVYIRKKKQTEQADETPSDSRSANESNALPIAGTVNIMTGRMTITEYGQYASPDMQQTVKTEYVNSARVVMPVIPRKIDKNEVELVFVVNGMEKSITLPENINWNAGKRNVINLTFTGEGIEIETSIKPWTDVEEDLIMNA